MSALRTSISLLIGAVLGFALVHAASPLSVDETGRAEAAAAQKAAADSDIIRSLLIGEFALQDGDAATAWKAFMTVAQRGKSADAAGRAFDIAQEAQDEKASDQSLKIWTELNPNNRQVRLQKAQDLMRRGQYDEAGALLKDLIEAAGDPTGALNELSEMQRTAPEKDKAYRAFVAAAAGIAQDPRAQLALSDLALRAGMHVEASEHAVKAMDLAPDSPHVIMKGIDAEFQNNPKQALSRLQGFLKRHPEAFELRLAYAKALLRTAETKTLEAELKTLEKGRRDDAHSMMLLGMLAEEAHLYERAERYYKRYLVLLSKLEQTTMLPDTAYVRLGMVKLAQGLTQEAVEWLGRVEKGDKYEAARIKQAELLAQQGNVEASCKVLRGIRTEDAKRKTNLNVACAELYLKAHRTDEALSVLIETVENAPKNPELLYKTAILATQLHRYEDAERLFERFIRENPDNPNGWNSLGFLWADRSVSLDKAERYLDKAMELSQGRDAFILDSVGWLRYRQGRLEEAETLVRKAQSDQPGDTEITLHLAEILYVLGKTREADGFIASVLEGEPNNGKAKELRQHRGPAK